MAEEKKNAYGYDAVNDVSTGGKYLNFKQGDKGKVIQIRLVSEPRYINQHWITDVKGKQSAITCDGDGCNYCGVDVPRKEKLKKTAKWGWIVIDREDGEVKVFTGPTLIARAIKDVTELVNKKNETVMWGDPTTYDFQIERTEQPGAAYYKVTPVVGTKEPLSEAEQKAVEDASFNLEEELESSKKSDNTGNYSKDKPNMETAPEKDEDVEVPEDLGKGDEDLPDFLK